MITAITGGIGTGKSYVANMLREKGIEVFDCDREAKKIMRSDKLVIERLTELIGPGTYHDDGSLNKSKVSKFLLASEANKLAINGIVHPAVAEAFKNSKQEWIESAILFESGFYELVELDRIVCVTAPRETRIERIMARDGISRQQAAEWIDAQMPQEEIIKRSDIELINDGRSNLRQQIQKLLEDKHLKV